MAVATDSMAGSIFDKAASILQSLAVKKFSFGENYAFTAVAPGTLYAGPWALDGGFTLLNPMIPTSAGPILLIINSVAYLTST